MQAATTAFEVIDALGLTRLEKRGGDLGGSVPLRVAQGCAPLFEGNAFGFQIMLRQPVTLRRGSGRRLEAAIAEPYGAALAAAHRAVLPRLVAQSRLRDDDPFLALFAEDFLAVDARRLHLWTGLLVRGDSGVWLRASGAGNRRNRLVDVEERFVPDGGFVPLVLTINLRPEAPDRVVLDGEIATLAPVAPGAPIDEAPLAEAPALGAAHAAFYDPAYFETKGAGVTRRYRRMKPLPDDGPGGPLGRSRLVTIGPSGHTIAGPVTRVAFTNLVAFEACYDGYAVTVEPDQPALRAGARAVERAFAEAMGPTFLGDHPRAIRYFTKYFTPHPPGEPHFFLKPWTFVQTPPGWSCLLEGVHGRRLRRDARRRRHRHVPCDAGGVPALPDGRADPSVGGRAAAARDPDPPPAAAGGVSRDHARRLTAT